MGIPPKNPESIKGRTSLGKDATNLSIRTSKGDQEMLSFIQERLGIGRAEAVRTSVRVYAALLGWKG